MLGKRILLLSLLFAAPLARAQYGAYADFTADRLTGLTKSSSTATNDSVNPTGGTFGVFYDFKTVGPVRLGADARFVHQVDRRGADATFLGAGTHLYSTLGGVRASFHVPIKSLFPYVQASAGLGRFSTTTTTLSNSFEYHVYGGVDYQLLPVVGWRVVEVGYGGLSNNSHNFPIASISTGIVLRFGGN